MTNWSEREEKGFCTGEADLKDTTKVCDLLQIPLQVNRKKMFASTPAGCFFRARVLEQRLRAHAGFLQHWNRHTQPRYSLQSRN